MSEEIQNSTGQILETLPQGDRPSLESFAPHPFSDVVEREAARTGQNIFTAAKHLGLLSAPAESLPPAVRRARQQVEQAEQKKCEADGKLSSELAAWDRYKGLLAQIGEKQKEIETGRFHLARCLADCAGYAADFDRWPAIEKEAGWRAVYERALSTCAAEKMVPQFEAWLEKATHDLSALESEAGMLRDKYDFV